MAYHDVEIVVHWTKQDMTQSSESGSCACSKQNRNQNEWSPSLDLLAERNEGNHQLRLALLNAALEGNIEEAKRLINKNSSMRLTSAAITEGQETIFHVAAGAKQTDFVEKMIELMTDNDLKLQNEKGNTAFGFAVMAGSESVAKTMLEKDPTLLGIRGGEQLTPLYLAVLFGQREMSLSLYRRHYKKNGILTGLDKKQIFFVSIDTTLYDLAVELLKDDNENELATNSYMHGECPLTPLHRLALTPLHLLDQSSKSDLLNQALELVQLLWKKILAKEGNQVGSYFNDHRDLLFDAAHLGNFIFLAELIRIYPDLVHQRDDHRRTIFHIAIMHRYDDLFKLIHNIGFDKQLLASYLDKDNNSLLHLAAKYPNPKPVNTLPSAALEMQRELQMFKDVERLVMPSFRELNNKDGKTPRELFTSTHKDLLKKGEKWMRDIANQCIIVATIIAIVAFLVAFNVPGENDFYRLLPLKLVVGVLTLFISIAAMMLALISSIFMAYDHYRSNVILILATIFVIFLMFTFSLSQYGLLRDILYYSSVRFRVSPCQDNARELK